jgi:putative DNA primase/helicase
MEGLGTTPAGNRSSSKEIQQFHYTDGEAVSQFQNAMINAGIITRDPIIGDSQLHRFHIQGHKSASKNGAYILHLDGIPAGWALDFKTGHSFTWRADGQRARLSAADRAAIEAERQRREVEQQDRQQQAANKAAYLWSKAAPASADHPYLIKKRIQPHGAKSGRDKVLILPLFNSSRELVNLQFIDSEGNKRFLSGGRKKGCFYWLGDQVTDPVLICEGFATGASLHEYTGKLVVIAFDAGNLKEVALAVRAIRPEAEIIICGDNDASGTGQKAAWAAALACGGKYILPPTVGQDWNDHLIGKECL